VSDTKAGVQRLEDLLGHNPSKELTGGDILQEAMKEIKEERAKEAKVKAKDMLSKAIELHRSITKADQEWRSKIAKFNKELGKVLNKLESFGQGQPVVEEQTEPEQKVEGGVLSQEQ
jgi:hypothetical protein